MIKLIKQSAHKILAQSKHLFLLITLIILLINIFAFFSETAKAIKKREDFPYIFLGLKFSGLQELLRGEKYIGYMTDKNMDIKADALQFSQAQYMLAPIILCLNNPDHKYLVFDFSEEKVAFEKMKELEVIPIRKNQFGIILGQNPHVKSP